MLTYLLMLTLQIVILVLIAFVFHWLFRRIPNVQHIVWLAAILSIGLAIPLQSYVPSLEMRIPIASPETAAMLTDELQLLPDAGSLGKALPRENTLNSNVYNLSSRAESDDVEPVMSPGVQNEEFANFTAVQFGCFAYCGIVFALVLRLMLGMRQLRQLANAARKTSSSTVVLEAAIRQIGLRRQLRVLVSDRVNVPMAFGIIRPTVLLPEAFETWSNDSQQAVLLHELSHIQRFDAFWDLMSRLVAVVYWFHPAVHFSISRLRQTRERATDQIVLRYGVSPTVYATQLLDVAAGSSRLQQPAIYMSCEGDIKNRIDSILNCVPKPPEKSLLMKCVLFVAFLALASISFSVSYGTIQQTGDTSTTEPSNQSVKTKRPTRPEDVTGKTFFERVQQVEPKEYKSNQTISIAGRVTDKKGVPVADAIVVFRDASTTLAMGSGAINDVLAKTTTRPDGTYSFDKLPNPVGQWGGSKGQLFCVSKDKIGFKYLRAYRDFSKLSKDVDIELFDTVAVTGRVVDPDGNPVAGTRVNFSYLSEPIKGVGVQKQNAFTDRLINPRSTTDKDGWFELLGLPSGFVVSLNFQHPKFATTFELLRTTKDHPEFVKYSSSHRRDVAENGATIELKEGVEFSGCVTDENGKPIKDVRVATDWRNCVTDANGGFALRLIERSSDSTLDLFVRHSGFSRIFKVKQSKLKDGTAKLQFLPPATIKGKVVSAQSGQPIEGFHVRFEPEDSDGLVRTRKSAADGSFEESIDSGNVKMILRSGDSRLFAEKSSGDGWEPQTQDDLTSNRMVGTFKISSGETKEITIRVPVRDAIRARVLNGNGDPVQGALVGYQSKTEGTVGFSRTNADGIAGVDPPDLLYTTRLLVARYDKNNELFFAETNTAKNVGKDIIVLKLQPSINVTGRVSVESEPLKNASVFIRRRDGNFPAYVVAKSKVNERGEYSIQVPRGPENGGIPNYRVEIVSTQIPNENISFAPNKLKLINGSLKGDVDLIRGAGKIAGMVVNSAGDPVPSALVEVQHFMMRKPTRKEFSASQLFESTSQYADQGGRFSFIGLPEGYEAIVVAKKQGGLTRGASVISVGNKDCKILITDGLESAVQQSRK